MDEVPIVHLVLFYCSLLQALVLTVRVLVQCCTSTCTVLYEYLYSAVRVLTTVRTSKYLYNTVRVHYLRQ
jgi:hypothetical protein